MTIKHNPFVYGRRVSGSEGVCRTGSMQTVFNRLRNAESTAIVGEPHSGKTSFLLQLTDPEIQSEYWDAGDKKLTFVNLDLHAIDEAFTTADFWRDALAPLVRLDVRSIDTQLEKTRDSQYNRQMLETLFAKLSAQNRLLVLLLDEFERLLKHKNFMDPGFFALLRSLSTRTGGVAIVLASRLSVSALNQLGRQLLDTGSPFFNNMIEINLPPFNDDEIETLLSKAEPSFSSHTKLFVRRAAGRNPFLLQAMAATVYEARPSATQNELAAEIFYRRTSQYFDDLWNYMDDETRTIAVILSLQDIGGRALGSEFSFGEIERVDAYGVELRKLAERGLAERLEQSRHSGWIWDSENLLVWRGERWGISCAAFTWWVRDVIIAATRVIPDYQDWLKQKRYRGLLTQGQWDEAQRLVKKIPGGMLSGVADLARSLWHEVTNIK